MLTEFGKEVKKARVDLGVSAREMADAIGVSLSLVSAIENGKRRITGNYLECVINYFQSSLQFDSRLRALAVKHNAEAMSAKGTQIPEGYALVPRKLTADMKAEFDRMHDTRYNPESPYRAQHTWEAMLKALESTSQPTQIKKRDWYE